MSFYNELKQTPENKRMLLEQFGYDTIYQAKKDFGGKAVEIYNYMFDFVNAEIRKENKKLRKEKLQKDFETKWRKIQETLKEKQNKPKKVRKPRKPNVDVEILRNPDDLISTTKEFFKQYKGQSIMYIFANGNDNIRDLFIEIPADHFSSWWNKNWFKILMIDSATTLFNMYPEGRILTYRSIEQDEKLVSKVIQYFREGVSHCVLNQVKEWAICTRDESKSRTAIARYTKIVKDTEEAIVKYDKGISETQLQEFCNLTQIDYTISLPFGDKPFIVCKSNKKNLKHFKATNTKLNHVEEITIDGVGEKLSRANLLLKVKEIKASGIHMKFGRDNVNINSISTSTQKFVLESEFNDTVNEFEKQTGICNCAIDALVEPELANFVRPHYNATVDFQDHLNVFEEIKHLDMETGYTQFKKNPYYCGFLGKISDFRQTDKMEQVGIYQIENLVFPESDLSIVLKKMFYNGCRYTSPELNYLKDHGVSFVIVAGAWGVEPLHFEFNSDMINKREILSENETDKVTGKVDSIRYYAKWAGAIDSQSKFKYEYMFGSYEFYQVLKNEIENIRYFENGEIQYRKQKEHIYNKSHITNFITAYMRLNVLQQLEQIKLENIVRVCVDGIYHTQKDVKLCNAFRPKPSNKFGNVAGESYTSNLEGFNYSQLPAYRKNYKRNLYIGAGGNGKTHGNLIDNGLVNVLFVAPSWKLALDKKNEYDCDVNVWANILSNDPQKIDLIKKHYNVLIIDEISMMTETEKQFIFKTYCNMKLIFCGDIGFQIGSITGCDMNSLGFDIVIENTENYRCKDTKLLEKLNTVRHMIKTKDLGIKKYILENFPNVSIEEAIENYSVEDMILTGMNHTKNYITEKLSGKEEKYYITANSREFSKGEIIIGSKPDAKCEIRHCFTSHSIQGETAKHKLFIDSSTMFCPRVFYTSLSRAQYMEQIFIINECSTLTDIKLQGYENIKQKKTEGKTK